MKEIWKDIKGYEGYYQISNFGRVKSLPRIVNRSGNKGNMLIGEKILTSSNQKYKTIGLKMGGKQKTYKVHKLVAISFLDHKPNGMVEIIDHIDGNKHNNKVDNLQIVNNRFNTSKGKLNKSKSSKYTGVYFNSGKWVAGIQIEGKSIYLGRFDNEYDAHIAYQKKLNN
jgi:hypothetical protein